MVASVFLATHPSVFAALHESRARQLHLKTGLHANLQAQAAATGCRSFAPIMMSHSMMASSPNMTGKSQLETLCSYCGHSMPVTLVARYAKQLSISHTPRMRGRNLDLYTSRPKGNSQSPQNISFASIPGHACGGTP